MENVFLLIRQILTMFMLAGFGFFLFRIGKISQEGSKVIGNILIYASLPAVIINSFMVERTSETLKSLAMSSLLSAASLLICVFFSRVIFSKDSVASFASTFSNPGFFGVPLVLAMLGQKGVTYMAPFIALLNLLQFTYGTSLITEGEKELNLKVILKAPFLTAIVIGLFLFFTQIPVPGLISNSIGYIAAINTPLGMFSVGIYLAQTDILNMFKRSVLYKISFSRLILIPLFVLLLMKIVPRQWYLCKIPVLIAAACPVGANAAVYAQLYDRDYRYAVESIVLSTFLSIGTIPLIIWLSEVFW